MKWLENTVKMFVLLTILRLESFVESGVRKRTNTILVSLWKAKGHIFIYGRLKLMVQ